MREQIHGVNLFHEYINMTGETMGDRVERIIISRKDKSRWKSCHVLCGLSRRLGNCAVYILRQRFFKGEGMLSRVELDTRLREQYTKDYRALPTSASAQRQKDVILQDFRSFLSGSKDYKVHPEKYTGEPKLPGYRRKYRNFVVGYNGFSIKDGFLYISGWREFGITPIPVKCCRNQVINAKAKDVVVSDIRILPRGNTFVVECVYREEETVTDLMDSSHACLIDLGVNNFATIASTRPGVRPVLVKGGIQKSINQKYNKDMGVLRSKKKGAHFAAKGFKRERQIRDCQHKISRFVVNWCVANGLGTIIIGHSTGWKQKSNMGKQNNQNFVSLPHNLFIKQLRYKAEKYGIKVIEHEESYTSKASALDFDPLPEYKPGRKLMQYSGRRIKRGLYRTAKGKLINADVNGALNVGRKELGDEWLIELLGVDGGVVDTPMVFRDYHKGSRFPLEAGLRPCEARAFMHG